MLPTSIDPNRSQAQVTGEAARRTIILPSRLQLITAQETQQMSMRHRNAPSGQSELDHGRSTAVQRDPRTSADSYRDDVLKIWSLTLPEAVFPTLQLEKTNIQQRQICLTMATSIIESVMTERVSISSTYHGASLTVYIDTIG